MVYLTFCLVSPLGWMVNISTLTHSSLPQVLHSSVCGFSILLFHYAKTRRFILGTFSLLTSLIQFTPYSYRICVKNISWLHSLFWDPIVSLEFKPSSSPTEQFQEHLTGFPFLLFSTLIHSPQTTSLIFLKANKLFVLGTKMHPSDSASMRDLASRKWDWCQSL